MAPESFKELGAAVFKATQSLKTFVKLWGDDHACGCAWSSPPCSHCTDCPECNCLRCDNFHYPDEDCPALLNPMAYKKEY